MLEKLAVLAFPDDLASGHALQEAYVREYLTPAVSPPNSRPLSLLLLCLLEHLLYDLLLLNQKCSNHSVLHTTRTSRSSVGSLDGFLGP